MAKRVNARRYSQAVFEIALAENKLESWQSDLQKIAGIVGDPALLAWLENPKITADDKVTRISGQMPGTNPLAMNLLRLLIARGKPGIIGPITDDYQRLLDSHRGIVQADVVTAVPLGDDEKERLAKKLAAIAGKKVVVKSTVDPAVIGGIVARIDGKLLDASTRSKLEALRRELATGGGKR